MRGFCHIGIVRAIERLGLQVDEIVGTSMGAVMGGLLAGGNDSHQMEQAALDVHVDERRADGGASDGESDMSAPASDVSEPEELVLLDEPPLAFRAAIFEVQELRVFADEPRRYAFTLFGLQLRGLSRGLYSPLRAPPRGLYRPPRGLWL